MTQPPGRFNPARFSGRSLSGGTSQTITGTGPALGTLAGGDALSAAVTWGTYSSPVGPVSTTQEMREGVGAWAPYNGATQVAEGETWQVRETASDGFATRVFSSQARTVAEAEIPLNVTPPSLEGNDYAGGPYTAYPGLWNVPDEATLIVQSSSDGATWSDEDAPDGEWDAALAGKYVRLKETVSGEVVYSAPFGPLGPAYDYVLNTRISKRTSYFVHDAAGTWLQRSLASSGGGADAPGMWFAAQWFYGGRSLPSGDVVGFGHTGNTYTNMAMSPFQSYIRAGGITAAKMTAAEVLHGSGWYQTTMWVREVAGKATVTLWTDSTSATAVASGTLNITGWPTVRVFSKVSRQDENINDMFDCPVAFVAGGYGDPSEMHGWLYNDGKLRNVEDYDFGADDDCALKMLVRTTKVGGGTWDDNEWVDLTGNLDNWARVPADGTGNNGDLPPQWVKRKPGFIDPNGDPPDIPTAYIYPRYATTYECDDDLTLCTIDSQIGAARPGDFSEVSLVHSIKGDISNTVTGITFPNPGVGTITGSVKYNGETVPVECEIRPVLAIPNNPQFADRYGGNALVAAIEPYVSPGAGMVFADVAALRTAIGGLAPGGTLIVGDLRDPSTLTFPEKDYGGATVIAENRHGVWLGTINLTRCANLRLVGFGADGRITGGNVGGLIEVEHCTSESPSLSGPGATIAVRNWIGPGSGASQFTIGSCDTIILERVAHAGTVDSDAAQVSRANRLFVGRAYFGDTRDKNPAAHCDCLQFHSAGSQGHLEGLVMDSVFIDAPDGSGKVGAQGLFLSDVTGRHLRVLRVAADAQHANNVLISNATTGCSLEEVTTKGNGWISAGRLNSALARDVITGSGTNTLATTLGPKTRVENGVSLETAYPQFSAHRGSWRAFANPASGYETKGAGALIAELELARLAL